MPSGPPVRTHVQKGSQDPQGMPGKPDSIQAHKGELQTSTEFRKTRGAKDDLGSFKTARGISGSPRHSGQPGDTLDDQNSLRTIRVLSVLPGEALDNQQVTWATWTTEEQQVSRRITGITQKTNKQKRQVHRTTRRHSGTPGLYQDKQKGQRINSGLSGSPG